VINLYYKDKPAVMSWVKKGENPFSKGVPVLPKEIKPANKKKFAKKEPSRRDSEELKEIKQILGKKKERSK